MDDTPVAHDSQVVGPPDEPGEESFHLTLCTPEWLSETCRRVGGIYNARHHLVVDYEEFDERALHAWLSAKAWRLSGCISTSRLGRHMRSHFSVRRSPRRPLVTRAPAGALLPREVGRGTYFQ